MSIPRRRFLALSGGLAATALGVSACGSNTGRPTGSDNPSSGADGPEPELTQWYHEYGEDGVKEAVTAYAAAYTPAQVTVKWNVGTNYSQLVSSALLTDKVPDVFEYEAGGTLDMIKAGQIVDLTETIGAARDQFSAPVLESMSWDGKIYAIPQTVDMQLLYYRKSLLDKAGVQPPETFEDLITVAKAVQTKDIGGFFAGNDGGVGVLGNLLIWAAGLEQLNDTRDGIGFAEDAMYAGLAQFAEFSSSDGLLQNASADWFDAAPFLQEETAMQWTGLWGLPLVQEAFGDDFGVLPFPKIGATGRPAVPFGAFGACVAAKGPNPAAAMEFVKWLWVDQEDKQIEFSDAFGTHVPAKTALAAQATQLASGAGAEAAKFVSDFGFANSKLWTPAITQAYTEALTNVAKKNADPQAEIAKVASTATAEIERVNG